MLNVIPMVTTNKIATECNDTKGNDTGIYTYHYKNQLNTKENSNTGNEGEKSYKA